MPARAAVIHARSGYAADLQTAINGARTGDTVSIPAGRYSFKGAVYAPDGIYIRGAGRDTTFLVKSDNTSGAMIIVDAKTGMPFKFSDITLEGRFDALQGTNRTVIVTTITDGGLKLAPPVKCTIPFRHSRANGNPGRRAKPWPWIPAFAGMTREKVAAGGQEKTPRPRPRGFCIRRRVRTRAPSGSLPRSRPRRRRALRR
jgi:hypothetical protein